MSFKVLAVCHFCAVFLQGTFATILNSGEIQRGACHLETFRADILLDCDVKDVLINIVTKDDDNMLVHCTRASDRLQCVSSVATHNESSNIMTFSTKFNHTKHAGKTMWVNSTCANGTIIKHPVLLKPCVSGFTAHGQHNTSHVTISCEHSSFKASNTGIRIRGEELSTLATCWWNRIVQDTFCTAVVGFYSLNNGVQHTTLYKPGMKLSCSLDGQNIPIPVHEQTTNNPVRHRDNGGKLLATCSVSLTFTLSILVYIIRRDHL